MKAPGTSATAAARVRSRADWVEAHARLDLAEEALRRADLPPEQALEALRERARALSRSAEAQVAAGREVLVFGCGGGQYGVDAAHAREILPLGSLTPVPRAAPFVAGVVHRRGEILMLVDVARLAGLPGDGIADRTKVVVVGRPGREVGIVAETVDGIRPVAHEAIAPSPDEVPFVAGVAEGSVLLLDVEAFLSAVGMTPGARP